MVKSVERKAKRLRLFKRQHGRCCYCNELMVIVDAGPKQKIYPPNMATFEHLDDRYSLERGQHSGERRILLACRRCNWRRNQEREREMGAEFLTQKQREGMRRKKEAWSRAHGIEPAT